MNIFSTEFLISDDLGLLTLGASLAKQRILAWAGDSATFQSLLMRVFGGSSSTTGTALRQQILSGRLSISIRVVEGLPSDIKAGYTSSGIDNREEIYLNSKWLKSASGEEIEAILLEEFGHALDFRINGSQDTIGDEGEIFSALLRGIDAPISAATENDHRTIEVAGQRILIEAAATNVWTRLYESPRAEFGLAVAAASDGSIYSIGVNNTNSVRLFSAWSRPSGGSEFGLNGSLTDSFSGLLRHYSSDGVLLSQSTIQDVGAGPDVRTNSAAVSIDNSLFIVGSTSINSSTEVTAFISRINSDGTTAWSKRLSPLGPGGTPIFNSEATDVAIAGDGSIYVTGRTAGQLSTDIFSGSTDIFLAKYNINGIQEWVRQFGSNNVDSSFSVTVAPDGSVFIGGVTYGILDGQPSNNSGILIGTHDGFISKFNPLGTRLWTRVISGDFEDKVTDLATAADSSVYAVGHTNSSNLLGQTRTGARDGFISRFTSDGTASWTRLIQGSTGGSTQAYAVSTGLDGFIYVSGETTTSSLDGQSSNGGTDGFISQFDATGNRLWSNLIGTSGEDSARDLISSGSSLYVIGDTTGNLNGQTNSGLNTSDIFLSKLDAGTAGLLPPNVVSLTVSGTSLIILLDKVLSSTVPALARFNVVVNGTSRSISGATVDSAARTVTLTLSTPVIFTDTVTLNYTDSTIGNDLTGVIQDAAGNDLASFSAPRAVTNLSDAIAPSITDVSVNSSSLTITLNETLSSILPDTARFLINVNGIARTISSVTSNPTARTVTLTLVVPVTASDTVTLIYSDKTSLNDTTGIIEDAAGNDLPNSNPISVTNLTPAGDNTPPKVISSEINGAILTLGFDEALANSIPEIARFNVLVNGLSRTISSVSIAASAGVATLQLATPVTASDVVTLSYTDKTNLNDSVGIIQDIPGNDLVSFSTAPVVNRTPAVDTTPPQITSLSVNGSLLRIIFNETLASTVPELLRFTVSVNGIGRAITSADIVSSNEVNLLLISPVISSDTVTLSYTDKSILNDTIGVIEDAVGNDLLNATNLPILNVTPPEPAPTVSGISINSATLILQLSGNLAATVPDINRFFVAVNGTPRQVLSTSVNTTSSTVSLTLISAVAPTDVVTVTYNDKTLLNDVTGVIENTAGVDLNSFSNRPADTYISVATVTSLNAIFTNLILSGTGAINGTGNANNNTITGNTAANTLNGGLGDDKLFGGLGNDTLIGGAGHDLLNGGAGTDTASYAGSSSAVRVDLMVTEAQNTLGAGIDTLFSIENLIGSSFADYLTGNSGSNTINGGAGADEMAGGLGNDTYVVDNPGDIVVEFFNAGTDLVQSSITFSLPNNGTENLTLTGTAAINGTGNTLNNVITGNAARNILAGGDGNDTLSGAAGDDDLLGGLGSDSLLGGVGNDLLDGGVGVDTASYAGITSGVWVDLTVAGPQDTIGAGIDTLISIENLTGSSFGDTLYGDGVNNTLTGGSGDDYLDGDAGNDILIGGAGSDWLIGGLGSNTFRFTALTDSLLLPGYDTISDLVIGVDVIDGPSAVPAANLVELGTVSSLDQVGIAALLTTATFVARGAATFSFGTQTFLALNDAVAGFDSTKDAVIEVTGFTGSLTSLSVV